MKSKFTVQEITTMALLAALLCVSSYISIRLPVSAVPITAQTLIVNITILLLTSKKSATTVIVWVLLGIAGLPVFSGGTSGIGVLAGPTGGYIIGYIAVAIIIPILKGKDNKYVRNLICLFIGILIIYACGVPWMMHVTGIGLKAALISGMVPFIPGDIIKAVLAASILKPLYRVVNVDK